jgi:hypothetical protein
VPVGLEINCTLPGYPRTAINFTEVDFRRFGEDFVRGRKHKSYQSVAGEHVRRFEDSKLGMFRNGDNRVRFIRRELFFQAETSNLREEGSAIRRVVFAFFPGLRVFGLVQMCAKSTSGLSARVRIVPVVYLSHFIGPFFCHLNRWALTVEAMQLWSPSIRKFL